MTSRIALLPDPVDPYEPVPRERARASLGIPIEGKYVGAVGSHAMPRKGSALLLEAFARAKLPADHRLLLAGPLGAELAGRLETEFASLVRDGRVVTLDRYLDEAQLMWSLSASDLVCTPYFDHMGSSGIVLRAAQAERPVLVPRMGWLGDVVPTLQLGDADDILDVDALARRLGPALEAASRFAPSPAGRRLVIYSDRQNFAARWSARLRERLGLPPAGAERTWSWVLTGQ